MFENLKNMKQISLWKFPENNFNIHNINKNNTAKCVNGMKLTQSQYFKC